MHPVAAEGAAVGALALGDLVFVVGEHKVLPAAVQVDGLAQVLAGHGAAFDVPARRPWPQGPVPERSPAWRPSRLRIGGVFFEVVVHLAAQRAVAALEVVEVQVAELAVLGSDLTRKYTSPLRAA